jgi:hypothetical protein
MFLEESSGSRRRCSGKDPIMDAQLKIKQSGSDHTQTTRQTAGKQTETAATTTMLQYERAALATKERPYLRRMFLEKHSSNTAAQRSDRTANDDSKTTVAVEK